MDVPPVDQPWRPLTVDEVGRLLFGAPGRWWLSGGEALDLFLGRRTRPHGDIDVSVQRSHWPDVAEYVGEHLELFVAEAGVLTPVDDWLPRGQPFDNVWARCRWGGPWRLQLNLEEVTGPRWTYRRDPRVQRPVDQVVWPLGGLPVVAPAVQLLWKAAAPRAVDEHDRRLVLPRLPGVERAWLVEAIDLAHPDSSWAGQQADHPSANRRDQRGAVS